MAPKKRIKLLPKIQEGINEESFQQNSFIKRKRLSLLDKTKSDITKDENLNESTDEVQQTDYIEYKDEFDTSDEEVNIVFLLNIQNVAS